MSKLLQTLVAAGFGACRATLASEKFGHEIWYYDSDFCEISIFEKGFAFGNKVLHEKYAISFAEVQYIKSFLTAPVLSSASKGNVIGSLVPIQIKTLDACLTFELPIQIYSGVLITLNELCGK